MLLEPPAAASPVAERMDLDAALVQLPPAKRLCVVLAYNEGMSHADISAATDAPGHGQVACRPRLRWQILAAAVTVILVLLNLRGVLITPWGWVASLLIGGWLLLRFRPSRR